MLAFIIFLLIEVLVILFIVFISIEYQNRSKNLLVRKDHNKTKTLSFESTRLKVPFNSNEQKQNLRNKYTTYKLLLKLNENRMFNNILHH